MPKEDFLEQAKKNGITIASPTKDIEIAKKLANKFKVSITAASIRLEKLKLANPGFYNLVENKLSKLSYSTSKSGGGLPAEKKKMSELGHLTIEIFMDAYDRK